MYPLANGALHVMTIVMTSLFLDKRNKYLKIFLQYTNILLLLLLLLLSSSLLLLLLILSSQIYKLFRIKITQYKIAKHGA